MTDRPLQLLGIGGSTRVGSKSRATLASALAIAEARGADVILADVRTLDFPLFNSDRPRAEEPATLNWLIEKARKADGIIVCSPTYHGSITGAVKNALDYLDLMADGAQDEPQSLADKAVGLIATGGGGGNVTTPLYHSVRALNAIVAPTVVHIANGAIDGDSGSVTDPAACARLEAMVDQVLDLAARLRR